MVLDQPAPSFRPLIFLVVLVFGFFGITNLPKGKRERESGDQRIGLSKTWHGPHHTQSPRTSYLSTDMDLKVERLTFGHKVMIQ